MGQPRVPIAVFENKFPHGGDLIVLIFVKSGWPRSIGNAHPPDVALQSQRQLAWSRAIALLY
jgi:hypothetical protein